MQEQVPYRPTRLKSWHLPTFLLDSIQGIIILLHFLYFFPIPFQTPTRICHQVQVSGGHKLPAWMGCIMLSYVPPQGMNMAKACPTGQEPLTLIHHIILTSTSTNVDDMNKTVILPGLILLTKSSFSLLSLHCLQACKVYPLFCCSNFH